LGYRLLERCRSIQLDEITAQVIDIARKRA